MPGAVKLYWMPMPVSTKVACNAPLMFAACSTEQLVEPLAKKLFQPDAQYAVKGKPVRSRNDSTTLMPAGMALVVVQVPEVGW